VANFIFAITATGTIRSDNTLLATGLMWPAELPWIAGRW